MIGRPEWFKLSKYWGWGVTPVTWQGWLYFGAAWALLIFLWLTPFAPLHVRLALVAALVFVVWADSSDIMLRIKRDEREFMHEAVTERNVAWTMIAALCIAVLYQDLTSIAAGHPYVDPFLIIVLFAGMLAKIASSWYLKNK